MLRALGSHFRDQWMGALALFLVLSGGTAYAAATIGSDDIVDGSVRSIDLRNDDIRTFDVRDDTQTGGGLGAADLRPGSVGVSELNPLAFAGPDISQDSPTSPFEIAPNAIQASEVTNGTLGGADVASNSLTGSDINESTLAGFDGHDAFRELCDTPSDNSFRTCLSVTFELGHAMEVLAIFGGAGSHSTDSFQDTVFGQCKTMLDGADKRGPWLVGYDLIYGIGLPTIIDVMSLSAGVHTVALACREHPTDVHFKNLSIGVVELGID